jgi:pimeloyl-ACP methyl ester carboxylesterase
MATPTPSPRRRSRDRNRVVTSKGEEVNTDSKDNYTGVDGLRMYYEIHGTGEPLILLHGGVGAIEMFGEVLPLLAEGRRVIAVDLQAHGRTADIDRPLSFESMADDIAALVGYLEIERTDVVGYSLGGGVALQTAIRHPEVVRKLVVASTPFERSGWYPEVLAGMEQMSPEAAEPMKQTPMYQLYASVAPKPQDWPVLLTKLGKLLRQDYDWSEVVEAIKAPTMIVVGDADSVHTAPAVRFFECSAAASPTPGETDRERPLPGSPSCPPPRFTISSPLLRRHPPSRRSSTLPCWRPGESRYKGETGRSNSNH